MSEYGGEILPKEEIGEINARSLMRAISYVYGVEVVERVFNDAKAAVEKGRRGTTVFGDFGEDEFAVAIDPEHVSLRFLNGATYSIETPDAELLLAEIKQEMQTD